MRKQYKISMEDLFMRTYASNQKSKEILKFVYVKEFEFKTLNVGIVAFNKKLVTNKPKCVCKVICLYNA